MFHLSPCSLSGLLLRASSSVFCYACCSLSCTWVCYISPVKSTLNLVKILIHLGYGFDNGRGVFSLMSCAGSSEGCRVRSCPPAWFLNVILRRSSRCQHLRCVLSCSLFVRLSVEEVFELLLGCAMPASSGCSAGDRPRTLGDGFTTLVPFRRQQHAAFSLAADAFSMLGGAVSTFPPARCSKGFWRALLCVEVVLAVFVALFVGRWRSVGSTGGFARG